MGREALAVEPDALEVLANYSWPGNVRQLQNVIKRILAMSTNQLIKVQDLPDELVAVARNSANTGPLGFFDRRQQSMAVFEKQYLFDLLHSHKGNIPAAATAAQLPRGTLYRLLKNHGLSALDFRQ